MLGTVRDWMTILAAAVVVIGGIVTGVKWVVTSEIKDAIRPLESQVGNLDKTLSQVRTDIEGLKHDMEGIKESSDGKHTDILNKLNELLESSQP